MASPERKQLERRAAASLELVRRDKAKRNLEKTVYGIVCPTDGLIRCWQDVGGVMTEVNKDPVVSIPIKMERVILTKAPIILIEGGRGSAKSESVSSIVACRVKDYGSKIGCFREFQNSIADSVHSIVKKKIDQIGLEGFTPTESKIDHENGGGVRYRGLARNPEGVKSMDGFTDFWLEEAQTISSRSLELVEPTLREEGSQIIYTLNRGSSADPISLEHLKPYDSQIIRDGFYEDENILIIQMNYLDNPWFPANLEQKRKKNKETWSPAKYRHVWEGDYNDEVENSLIPVEWFEACVDAHEKLGFEPKGAIIATHDPSDEGGDTKGFSLRQGSVILDVQEREFGDVNSGMDWAMELAVAGNCDHFGWDFDGIGMGLKRQVEAYFKGRKVQIFTFQGGREVDNPDQTYDGVDSDVRATAQTNSQLIRNKRAQYYWRLRNKCYNTYRAVVKGEYIDPNDMISFSSEIKDMNAFKSQLCRIPRKKNPNGMLQIVSKVDMVKAPYNLPSPGGADCVMMGQIEPEVQVKKVKLKFNSISR